MNKPFSGVLVSCLLLSTASYAVQSKQAANINDLNNRVQRLEEQVSNNEMHIALMQNKHDRPLLKYISPSPLSLYDDSLLEVHNDYSSAYITGWASAGFIDVQHYHSSFFLGSFSPQFIFNYNDLFQFESLVQFVLNTRGFTNTSLQYAYLDWFITKHITLVGGKFYSPMGMFVNSLYPDWINKLPTRPAGFDYGEAAPISDVGVQVRGDIPLPHEMSVTYVFFGGNGPRAYSEDSAFTYIDSNGTSVDEDGHKVFGARLAFLPTPSLEFGISAATGQVGLINPAFVMVETSRSYQAYDIDANYHNTSLDLRAEYVEQRVGPQAGSIAPNTGIWRAWYAQAAYKILQSKWEAVLRAGCFGSPYPAQSQQQLAIGINYWFSRTIVAKTAYEVNRGQRGNITNANNLIIQFAYGF